jgi:hypothetical protein
MKIKRASRWIHFSSHQPSRDIQNTFFLAALVLLCSASRVSAQSEATHMQVMKLPVRIGPDPIYSGIGMEKEASWRPEELHLTSSMSRISKRTPWAVFVKPRPPKFANSQIPIAY